MSRSAPSPGGSLPDALALLERTAYVVGRPVPIAKRIVRPAFTWDDAAPGRSFPSLEYVVTQEAVDRFRSLASDLMPGQARTPTETVPALFFSDEPMQCINTLYAQSGRLHAGHRIEVLQPIPVGALVRSSASVVGRQMVKGRPFVDVACTVCIVTEHDATPRVVVTATLLL